MGGEHPVQSVYALLLNCTSENDCEISIEIIGDFNCFILLLNCKVIHVFRVHTLLFLSVCVLTIRFLNIFSEEGISCQQSLIYQVFPINVCKSCFPRRLYPFVKILTYVLF